MRTELFNLRIEEIASVGKFRLKEFRKIKVFLLLGNRFARNADFAGTEMKRLDIKEFRNLRMYFIAEKILPDRTERQEAVRENPLRPVLPNPCPLP